MVQGVIFNEMRSKTKCIAKPITSGDPADFPTWSFDGSSTGASVAVVCTILGPWNQTAGSLPFYLTSLPTGKVEKGATPEEIDNRAKPRSLHNHSNGTITKI